APHLAGPSQAIRKSISKLVLDSEIRILVQILTAMRNGCAFCADLALAEGVKKKIGREKFQALGIWLSDGNKQLQSEQFTEKQMVALELADLIASHSVTDEAFANAGRFFNERELIEIAWVVSVESYYNALNGALGIGSDHLAAMVSE
ncbi:MAG: hypothetical protein K8S54_20965, partial [Spirochaetia bacterium]|nr:hypothetical protein [Spirochaetia bacterium]